MHDSRHNIPKEEQNQIRDLAKEFGFHINTSHGISENQRGGAMLLISLNHFDEIIYHPATDRLAISTIRKGDQHIKLASIYAPVNSTDRALFFDI